MTWVLELLGGKKKHQHYCTKVPNSAVENAWLVISCITNYYIAWRGSIMLNKGLFIENEYSSTEEGWVILQRGNIVLEKNIEKLKQLRVAEDPCQKLDAPPCQANLFLGIYPSRHLGGTPESSN